MGIATYGREDGWSFIDDVLSSPDGVTDAGLIIKFHMMPLMPEITLPDPIPAGMARVCSGSPRK